MEKLTISDYLLIAEAVLDVPATELLYVTKTGLAESALEAPFASWGGDEFYPELSTKAAILCSRVVANHPLPNGNKRVAYLAMREFLERNGATWLSPGVEETVEMVERLAGEPPPLSEADFIEWVQAHVE
jgi:death on curing protein